MLFPGEDIRHVRSEIHLIDVARKVLHAPHNDSIKKVRAVPMNPKRARIRLSLGRTSMSIVTT